MPLADASTRTKKVLLINAVVWPSPDRDANPLRDVVGWYARWLAGISRLTLVPVTPESEVLAMIKEGVDGVILSGSPRDAWAEDPVNTKLCEVILACQDRGTPFLGVCYGHQVLGRALGGLVARHPQGLELGNTDVELTEAGRKCPLFRDLPDRFSVLSSHADAVLEMPAHCELLVRGDFTVNQGFHWNGQLFGVQFHPETDPEVLRFIWSPRLEKWRQRVSFDLAKRLESLQPTPWAGRILRNFVNHLVL
jgi:GMP synthase (glutamine-hydrolysing)